MDNPSCKCNKVTVHTPLLPCLASNPPPPATLTSTILSHGPALPRYWTVFVSPTAAFKQHYFFPLLFETSPSLAVFSQIIP